eukprot:gene3414-3891_t
MAAAIPAIAGTAIAGAAQFLPMVQEKYHHDKELGTARELHRAQVKISTDLHEFQLTNAKALHDEGLRISQSLHELEISNAQSLHKDQKELAEKLHMEQHTLNERLHNLAVKQASTIHKQAKELAETHHTEQLKVGQYNHGEALWFTKEAARRENLRDMWSQKSRKADTLMVTTTLMFGCFFMLIVEGNPPEDSWYFSVVMCSITVSLSFFFLILCLWFTMKYSGRMAEYNIYKSTQRYKCHTDEHSYKHGSFESYYFCHCRSLALQGARCLFAGIICLLLTAANMAFCRFYFLYDNLPAGIVFVLVTAITIASIIILQCLFPTSTRQHGTFHEDMATPMPEPNLPSAFPYHPAHPIEGSSTSNEPPLASAYSNGPATMFPYSLQTSTPGSLQPPSWHSRSFKLNGPATSAGLQGRHEPGNSDESE